MSDDLVVKAYASTMEPWRLEELEFSWEYFLDSNIENANVEQDLSYAPVHLHFTRALEILERLGRSKKEIDNAQSIVDDHDAQAFIVDQTGRLIALNDYAKALIDQAGSISDVPLDDQAIKEIQTWISPENASESRNFLFTNCYIGTSPRKRCLLTLPINVPGRDIITSRQSLFLVSMVDLNLSLKFAPTIQQAFGMSLAESEIVVSLANGMNSPEIAQAREVSIHTVRKQIKNAQKKTGASGTADLVRVICGLMSKTATLTQQGSAQMSASNTLERAYHLTLKDGRKLAYREIGHPNGRPVIYLSCSLVEILPRADAAKAATLNNWRLICPSRPGQGASSPNPKSDIRDSVHSFSNDIIELMDHLGLKSALAIGSTHALSLAQKAPDRIKGMLSLGHACHWDKSFLKSMPPRYRNMIKTSIYAPKAVAFLLRVSLAMLDSGHGKTFLMGMQGDNEIDKMALEDPENFQILINGLHHNMEQNVYSFSKDVALIHTDWLSDFEELKCSVTVMHGAEDTLVTQDWIAPFLRAVPHAKSISIANGGKFLLLTHFPKILGELEDLWAV